jgi:hypothetical protein
MEMVLSLPSGPGIADASVSAAAAVVAAGSLDLDEHPVTDAATANASVSANTPLVVKMFFFIVSSSPLFADLGLRVIAIFPLRLTIYFLQICRFYMV